jgi:hypothetical protein
MWGDLSDERTGVPFTIAARSCQHSHSWARSPYLYPPGAGWPSYTPRHWVPFSFDLILVTGCRYIDFARTTQKTQTFVDETYLPLGCLEIDIRVLRASVLRVCVYRLVA